MKKVINLVSVVVLLLANQSFAQEVSPREPFDDRYCMTCHGVDGRGNEGVQAPRLAGMEPWYLKRQLESFRAGMRGSDAMDIEGVAMLPMAKLLTDASIVDIVGWVASWTYVPAEVTIAGNTTSGRALYQACASCHGQNAEGNESLAAPALRGQNDWYLVTQLKNFRAGYRGSHAQDTYGAQMRAMASVLQDDGAINDVVSYINSLETR